MTVARARIRSFGALALVLGGLAVPLFLVPPGPPRPLPADDPVVEDATPLPEGAVTRLGTTRFRHGWGRVKLATVSPDGAVLATAGEGRSTVLWDARTGQRLREIQAEDRGYGLHALAFSPDGRTLACAGDSVSLWDAMTGRLLGRTKDRDDESYRALAFSPDGTRLAVGTGGYVVGGTDVPSAVLLLESPTGRKVARMGGCAGMVEGVAFAPDGAAVAAASRDHSVRLWDVRTGNELRRYGRGEAAQTSVAFSPDGKALAAGDWEGRVTLWDVARGAELWQSAGHSMPVEALAFPPDGSELLAGPEYRGLRLLDAATGRERAPSAHLPEEAWFGAYTPDGRRLVLWGDDGTVHLWNRASSREEGFGVGHTSSVRAVAVGPDSSTVASVSFDGVRLWNAPSGKHLRHLGGRRDGWSVALSPDGRLVASGGSDGRARVWSVETGRRVREFNSPDSWVSDVAFSPDGRRLFVSGTFVVQAWDLETGRRVRQYGEAPPTTEYFDRLPPPLSDLVVSPDGQRVAVSWHGGIRLWDVATGAESRPSVGDGRLSGPLAFSPNGTELACRWYADWDDGICLWDVAAGKESGRIKLGWRKGCGALAYAPDGCRLAGACADGIRVWSVPGWRERAFLRADGVNCLTFSPDGKYLVSGSSDTTLLVWDASRVTNR